jgi:hypothetical protein
VIAVNLRGPFLCTRAALRIMKPQGGGRIINIGSISAQRVRPKSAPYSASKFGIVGLTHVTALEGRDHGITCCCLHPGNIKVERRFTERQEDAEPMMSIDEISEVALLMATLPPHVEMLEAIVLPHEQLYVGRGTLYARLVRLRAELQQSLLHGEPGLAVASGRSVPSRAGGNLSPSARSAVAIHADMREVHAEIRSIQDEIDRIDAAISKAEGKPAR